MKHKFTIKQKLMALGPGILVVGSFIGPGTITSATKAGANYGYDLFWTVIFSVIAVIVMQEMAARLGIVTRKGLAKNIVADIKDHPLLKIFMVTLVSSAIGLGGVAYMGGDLTGTAIGVSTLTGMSTQVIAPIWGLCVLILVNLDNAIKKLELFLATCVAVMAVVFVVTMFVVKPDVLGILKGSIPNVPSGSLFVVVAMIGTTVVPYNMFIHAISAHKTWEDVRQLALARFDVNVSMIIGGIITGAVLITAGTVMLGMDVNSAADMSTQLKPLLGNFAEPFLAAGLIAAGASSAVITPLGVSLVFSGLFGWEQDRSDKRFLWTNNIVVVFGIIVASAGFKPIPLILTAQAINGVFLPIIVLNLVYITSKNKIMGHYKNQWHHIFLGACVFTISLIIGVSSVLSLF